MAEDALSAGSGKKGKRPEIQIYTPPQRKSGGGALENANVKPDENRGPSTTTKPQEESGQSSGRKSNQTRPGQGGFEDFSRVEHGDNHKKGSGRPNINNRNRGKPTRQQSSEEYNTLPRKQENRAQERKGRPGEDGRGSQAGGDNQNNWRGSRQGNNRQSQRRRNQNDQQGFNRNTEERTSGRSEASTSGAPRGTGGYRGRRPQRNDQRGGSMRRSSSQEVDRSSPSEVPSAPSRQESKDRGFHPLFRSGVDFKGQDINTERDGLGVWQQNYRSSGTDWDMTQQQMRAGSERPASPTNSVTSTASSVRRTGRKKSGGKRRGSRGGGAPRGDFPPRGDNNRRRNEDSRRNDVRVAHQEIQPARIQQDNRRSIDKSTAEKNYEQLDVRVSDQNLEWEGGKQTFQSSGRNSKGEAPDWQQYTSVGRQRSAEIPIRPKPSGSVPLRNNDLTDLVSTSFDDLISKHSNEQLDWSQEVEEEYVRTHPEGRHEDHPMEQRSGRGLLPTPADFDMDSRCIDPYQSDYGGARGRGPKTRGMARGMISSSYYTPVAVVEPRNFQKHAVDERIAGRGRGRGAMIPESPLVHAPGVGPFRGGGHPRGGGQSREESHRRHPPSQPELPPRFQRLKEQQNGGKGNVPAYDSEQRNQRYYEPESSRGMIHLPRGTQLEDRKLSQQRDRDAIRIQEKIDYKIVPEIARFNDQLNGLLDFARRSGNLNVQTLHEFRLNLQTLYRELLPMDLERTFKINLEGRMWKEVFYTPIEAFRFLEHHFGPDTPEGVESAKILRTILDQSSEFYDSLLREWEERYGFFLQDELYEVQSGTKKRHQPAVEDDNPEFPSLASASGGIPRMRSGGKEGSVVDEDLRKCLVAKRTIQSKNTKLALSSCARFFLARGDIERYKALGDKVKTFGEARSWYLKSVQLGPGNGRCYNQLGLLGMYTHRFLDAVYYFIRALAAKYSFETANQSLKEAFESIHRRMTGFEHEILGRVEQMKQQEQRIEELSCRGNQRKRRRPITMRGGYQGPVEDHYETEAADFENTLRREVWIGGSSEKGDSEREQRSGKKKIRTEGEMQMEILLGLSTREMYNGTQFYFLQAVSILVQKIGMETFEMVAEKALRLLQELLKSKSENPLTPTILVKLSTITLYAYHVSSQETDQKTCTQRLQYAVQLILSLWGILMEQVRDRLCVPEHFENSESIPPELQRVLPAARLISMWVSTPSIHKVYSGIPSLDGLDLELFRLDVWETLASLCNKILVFMTHYEENKEFSSGPKPGFPLSLVTPEEWLTISFYDFVPMKPNVYYWKEGVDWNLESCALKLRLKGILEAGEFLDGQDLRQFRYDHDHDKFIALSPQDSPTHSLDAPRRRETTSDEESAGMMDLGQHGEEISEEFQRLHLSKMGEIEKQEVLSREAQNQGLVLEIEPSILIPDTNCFIDYLAMIKDIVRSERFTFAVPVTVLNELRGLTKSDQEWVAEQCLAALEFLNGCINRQENRRKIVQAITTQGNLIHSLQYNTEEFGNSKEQNDDKILSCCISLVEDDRGSGIRDLKNEPIKLRRKMVLLTGDRALRIKAFTQNIPSKSIPAFVEWASIGVANR